MSEMPDFPVEIAQSNYPVLGHMSTYFLDVAQTVGNLSRSSGAWPTANLALFWPFVVSTPSTALKMYIENGATVSGNVDTGIYDSAGNRIVSIGSTAQTGATALQIFDITDTLLMPGIYYSALSFDNTTATLNRIVAAAPVLRSFGCYQMASAFPLPATATRTAFTSGIFPCLYISTAVTI